MAKPKPIVFWIVADRTGDIMIFRTKKRAEKVAEIVNTAPVRLKDGPFRVVKMVEAPTRADRGGRGND